MTPNKNATVLFRYIWAVYRIKQKCSNLYLICTSEKRNAFSLRGWRDCPWPPDQELCPWTIRCYRVGQVGHCPPNNWQGGPQCIISSRYSIIPFIVFIHQLFNVLLPWIFNPFLVYNYFTGYSFQTVWRRYILSFFCHLLCYSKRLETFRLLHIPSVSFPLLRK